jgi:hypothetical protein
VPSLKVTLSAVTYKMCNFVLTLATAIQVSEIHILSASTDCYRRDIDGSITLMTFTVFCGQA